MVRVSGVTWFVGLALALLPLVSIAQPEAQSQLDFANGLFSRGFYADAAQEYRAYLETYPQAGGRETAQYRLGESLFAQRDFAGAANAFASVRESYPNGEYFDRARLREGVSLYRTKQYKPAKQRLVDVEKVAKDPNVRGEALYYLGKLNADTQEYAASVAAYERLVKDVPTSSFAPFAQYQLASVYLAQKKYEAAAGLFMQIGENTSLSEALQMEALYRAGEAYDLLGWHDAAATSYGKLKQRYPQSEYAQKADYGLAWSLYRTGKFDESIATLNAFMKNHPTSPLKPGLEYLHANCLLKKGEHAKAEALFASVAETYPDMPYAQQARYKLAVSLMDRGATDQAVEHLRAMVSGAAKSSLVGDASFLLGKLLMDSKQYAEATLQFLRVVEQYPSSEFAADSLYKLGESYALDGKLEQSAQTFESFAKQYTEHALAMDAVFHSADAYFQLGQYQDALVRFQHVSTEASVAAVREEATYRVAITYHNLNKPNESQETFAKLLKSYSESRFAAEARYRIGDYLLQERNAPVEAIEHFIAVARKMEKNAFTGRALKGIAVAHYQMKDFDGAAGEFHQVIRNYPDLELQPSTYEWVGQHLFDRGEWGQAIDVLTALLERVPGYAQVDKVRLKLGDAYAGAAKYGEALTQYEWIRENREGSSAAHEAAYRAAGVLEKQKKNNEAATLYETVASAAMNDTAARARFRLGEMSEEAKEFDAAAKHYMRVAILFLHAELSPESLWRAGQCYEKASNTDSALKLYQDLVSEYPETEQAKNAKARLAELKG